LFRALATAWVRALRTWSATKRPRIKPLAGASSLAASIHEKNYISEECGVAPWRRNGERDGR
jgi:hypothetical protein